MERTEAYQNLSKREKAQKFRLERTEYEKGITHLIKYQEYTVYLLLIIAMILVALFVRAVASGFTELL